MFFVTRSMEDSNASAQGSDTRPVVAGASYGVSCAGCSTRLMAAALIGMTSLGWMVIIGAVVLVYKLGPPLAAEYGALVSAVVAGLGVAYLVLG